MSGGTVRDRVAALQSSDKKHNDGSPGMRRHHKLPLKTDEHIKEEFLRRGDGGWSKTFDIGQQQPSITPQPMPFIKVTSETPIAPEPRDPLPGKLSKGISGPFEPIVEALDSHASGLGLAEQRSTEKETEDAKEQDVPVSKYESLLDEEDVGYSSISARSRDRSRASSRKAYVEDHDEAHEAEEEMHPRDRIIFDPAAQDDHDDESKHRRSKHRRRKSYQRERAESHSALDDHVEDEPRARSRSSRTHSEKCSHSQSIEEAHLQRHRREYSSRSRSRHECYTDAPHTRQHSPPEDARRPSHSLWPSFSQSERRSLSDIFDTASFRPRSSHSRTRSDISNTSTYIELSPKRVEFAEYIAGKKLNNLPNMPLRPSSKPMGYVRSRSSTGEYSEYYTREKRLLRKPSREETVEHIQNDRGRKERHPNRHVEGETEPWQIKLMQGIAKM